MTIPVEELGRLNISLSKEIKKRVAKIKKELSKGLTERIKKTRLKKHD